MYDSLAWWTGPFKSLSDLLAYSLLGLDPKSHETTGAGHDSQKVRGEDR